MKFKTFPLTVTEEWLNKVEKAKDKHESKHEFIIRAVDKEIEAARLRRGGIK